MGDAYDPEHPTEKFSEALDKLRSPDINVLPKPHSRESCKRGKSYRSPAPASPRPPSPTREGWTELHMSPGLSVPPQVQSTGDMLMMGEDENAVRAVLNFPKGQASKGCSRFLPKGTKAKVNLEDQGRQKVSFTFNVTKTLRNRFQSAIGSELDEVKTLPTALPLISVKGSQDNKSDSEAADAPEVAKSSPPKSKVEWSKVHFKKKQLNDAAKPLSLSDREQCSPSVEEPVEAAIKKLSAGGTETVIKVTVETKPTNLNLGTSHVGKDDNIEEFKNVSLTSENDELGKLAQTEEFVQALSADSESEMDLVRKSPSLKSHDTKNAESSREVKKYPAASRTDEVEKVSSHSKSERDRRSSGRSKSDRDTRKTSSHSKYGREERLSSSRSRSDRDSRAPSSYSKSDWSRSSYYSDKDRYRRGSPYSERSKSSRSKLCADLRDASSCSDSEEDSRRYHPRSNDVRRTSLHSKSYRDSRKYQSRSDRDLRATSSCSESEREIKRTKSHSKADKVSRIPAACFESESSKTNSSEVGLDSRKLSKSDCHSKICHSKSSTSCHKPEAARTNVSDLELDYGKISKSDSHLRMVSSHSKSVFSCHEVLLKKNSPGPEIDLRKNSKLDSNSKTHSKTLVYCEIEGAQGDSTELGPDSRRNFKSDINSQISPQNSKSTNCYQTKVDRMDSSEPELDSWTNSTSDRNVIVTRSRTKAKTFCGVEIIKTDPAGVELDSQTCSGSDKHSVVTPSHSNSYACLTKVDSSEPETEVDLWENSRLDRKSRINVSSSRFQKIRTLPVFSPDRELRRISSSESEDEMREVPELHNSGTKQNVFRSDDIYSSLDHQSDSCVSTSPYPTSDLSRTCCLSRPSEIAGSSHSSKLDGLLTKVSSCSESDEECRASSRCESNLMFSSHDLPNDLQSPPHFIVNTMQASPYPSPDEVKYLAYQKVEEFNTSHYTKREHILAYPKMDEFTTVSLSNLDETVTISADPESCMRDVKLTGKESTENGALDSQKEQHANEGNGCELKNDKLFHSANSFSGYTVRQSATPSNQNWDSVDKVRLYMDLPSHINSEAKESGTVKTEPPSSNNEEISFIARPDSSVKVEPEQRMEISEDEGTEEELTMEVITEGPLHLSPANLMSPSEVAHNSLSYRTKSDCDSSCMKVEYNSVSSENGDCSEDAKSSSEQESEESESSSDSDDGSVPKNRLQSVVIVPKNSTLTLEEKSPMSSPSSSISSSRISQQEKKHSAVEISRRETDEKPNVVHQPNGVELGNILWERAGDPVGGADKVQGTLSLFQEVSEDQPQASSSQLSPVSESHKGYKQQLLTDKADSTSQPERFSIDQNQLPLSNEKSGSVESPGSEGMTERYQHSPSSHLDSLTTEQNSAHGLHGEDKSFGEKPDSRQAVSWPQRQAQDQGSFHSPEYLESLDWDFSQPEKPSSSCQQPDSSYGLYRKYCYQTEEAGLGKTSDHWQDKRASWDPKLNVKSVMCNNYQLCQDISGSDVQGQVQPDSMTDDFASYDNWETVNRDPRSVPKGVSSLQAHEITSNSTKGTTLVLKASDSTADKESRVRELEKKLDDEQGYSQKPQMEEADTDLESDADTRYCEQVRVEPDPLVTVPSKGWVTVVCKMEEFKNSQWWKEQSKLGMMPPYFELIEENLYLTERKKSKSHRDIKRMQCECVLSREDRERGELACGEDCLNRLLMIECSSRCLHGEYCTNRRFQRRQYADVEVILTERKGWGLRTDKELSVNSFVLEYCGEVLDHKEFKTRVKEYARNKNVHYYFMALKNDEIIDATLKGNCSRFMNHSCEPNCETQKWTVNGQLRVGFFTTKTVPAGTELTFDYQFQRYGKEAQKCFCGSANCRGYLGGENRVSIRAAGGKVKLKDKDRSRKKDSVDEELEAFLENGDGLCDSDQVLSLTRLMVRIETIEQKLTCLKIIQNTHSQSCLKSFLEYHGLSLLWIWMTELGDSRGNSSNSIKLQTEIMKTLELLPIPTKNMLEESKLLPIIQRWAQSKASVPPVSEADGYSSENTSRAQTPLNTQDTGLKQSCEGDSDTPKKLVMRRLKIMSENSMDSGLSDTSKASDGEIELKEAKDEVVTTVEPLPCLPTDEEEIQSEVPGDEAEPHDSQDPTLKAANGTKLDDGALVETPSQDEEEGVSDVESERSQEQSCKIEDVSELATKLLDVWKDLKEVYRIPKKDRTQTERESIERGREGTSQKDASQVPKTPVNLGKEKDADKSLSKDRKKRRPTTSPPPSAYEREGLKRSVPDERYDGATPAKKKKTRSKLSTEERRKLFEQEVAQREAQKQNLFLVQQQQIQPICVSSQVPFDSGTYTTSHQNFATYPPGYPLQTYVDPVNPNAGKVLLPTPNVEPMCPPQMSYEHPQPILGESMPTGHPAVQHLSPQIDVQGQQYLAQTPNVISQDPSVAVIQVSGTQATGQSYGVWDPSQQTLSVHQQYTSGQSQTPIYYQGQPCQTVYSISSPYGQATPQIVQSYTQSSPECAQGQQCFLTHPQSSGTQPATGMLVTSSAPSYQQPGQPQTVQQQELIIVNNLLDLPPPSPPKPKTIVLPTNWKTARDPEGKIYYYHVITRQTQWDPPLWDGGSEEMSMGHEAEMDLGTPTYDEHPAKDPMLTDRRGPDGSGDGTPNSYSQSTKKKPKTAEADTSSELAKRSKEMFRKEISQFIVLCLNPYRKPDCKIGRIVATEDFKHLARKLTHGVMNKELKQCKNPEDLECNENVKHKTKEYIKKYMQKFGAVYKPKEEPDVD